MKRMSSGLARGPLHDDGPENLQLCYSYLAALADCDSEFVAAQKGHSDERASIGLVDSDGNIPTVPMNRTHVDIHAHGISICEYDRGVSDSGKIQ